MHENGIEETLQVLDRGYSQYINKEEKELLEESCKRYVKRHERSSFMEFLDAICFCIYNLEEVIDDL
jgi:hypothetical protein